MSIYNYIYFTVNQLNQPLRHNNNITFYCLMVCRTSSHAFAHQTPPPALGHH